MSNLPAKNALNETRSFEVVAANVAAEAEERNVIESKRESSSTSGDGDSIQLATVTSSATAAAASSVVDSELVDDSQVKQTEEDVVFGDHFDYNDYLFDTNSNSVCVPEEEELDSAHHHQQASEVNSDNTQRASTSASLASSSDQILSFDLDHHHHHHHQQQQQQLQYGAHHHLSEAEFVPSSLVTSSHRDNTSPNDYLLFDTSMLDTATDLSEMPETSPTSATTSSAPKVVDYYNPSMQPPLSQSSSTLTPSSMSQQMSLESHHHQSQQQQQHNQPMLDDGSGGGAAAAVAGDYVQYHRMNGNGNHDGTQVVNDSNNNPVVDMADDMKNNTINTMLGTGGGGGADGVSLVDPIIDTSCNTSNNIDSGHMSQNTNQYITSNVGQMMDSTASANSSNNPNQITANQVMMMEGTHPPTSQHQQQHHMESHQLHQQQPNSNDDLLNIIPNEYNCMIDQSDPMHLDGLSGAQHQQQQQQQSQSQPNLQSSSQSVGCLPDDTNLYHSHHMQLQQQQQPQSQHPMSSQNTMSLQDPNNQMSHLHQQATAQSHHYQTSQQPHQQPQSHHSHHSHHAHHHQIVANAQSNTTMESYGQSAQMRDIISESPLMDSSSANASSGGGARASTNTTTTAPPSQTSTNPNQTTAQNIQQQTSARVSMNSTSSVPSSASSHDNIYPQTSTPVSSTLDLKADSSNGYTPSNDYLQQYHHPQPHQSLQADGQQQQQLVNSSSTSNSSTSVSSSTLLSSTSTSMLHHSLTSTAHQRPTAHFMPSTSCDNTTVNSNQQQHPQLTPPASMPTAVTSTNSSNGITTTSSSTADNNVNNASINSNTATTNSSSGGCSNVTSSENVNQLLNQFNAAGDVSGSSIDSASTSSSANTNNNCFVLMKCDQPQHQSDQNSSYQEQSKSSLLPLQPQQPEQQHQYDSTTVSSTQQSQDSLNPSQNSTVTNLENVQHVQHPLAQQHNTTLTEGVQNQSSSCYTTPPTSQVCVVTIPNKIGSNNTNNNANNGGMVNMAGGVQTVALATMPAANHSAGGGSVRPLCVITDPNSITMHATGGGQPQTQPQLNYVLSPNNKIRFTANPSLMGHPTLLFASKTSPLNHHQQLQQSSTPTVDNPGVVQAMIVAPNFATFNQQQSFAGNTGAAATGGSAVTNLTNLDSKQFVSLNENIEQNYQTSDMLSRQYSSTQMQTTSSTSTPSVATGQYHTVAASSSIPSGSQFGQVQSNTNIAQQQHQQQHQQIFFNNTQQTATNIRILEPCSIVSLQPSALQNSNNSSNNSGGKAVSQKILLQHSMPNSGGTGAGNTTPTTPTLISINQSIGHLQVTTPNNNLVNNSIPSGSIIFSSVIQNSDNNIPGTHGQHAVTTNFAVPIPVVTSTIGNELNPIASNSITTNTLSATPFTLNAAATGAFPRNTTIAVAAAAPGRQPNIVTNMVAIGPGGGAHVVPLATKSTKLPNNKTASKSSVSNVASASSSSSSSKSNNAVTELSLAAGQNLQPMMSGDPAKPFKCQLCNKNLASKNVYQLHLRSHSGEKPFVCTVCNNRFSQKTSLTRHTRSHTGERPFPCQICNKRFADKERIKIHMRIHTGEKPFSCSVCMKKFSQKSTVKRHMSVHTGVKPFKCERCGKGFANRGNLTAHKKTHNQQQPPQSTQPSHPNQQQQHPQPRNTATVVSTDPMANSLNAATAASALSQQQPQQMAPSTSTNRNNGNVKVEIKMEVDDSIVATDSGNVKCEMSRQPPSQQHNQYSSATQPLPSPAPGSTASTPVVVSSSQSINS